MKDRVKWEYHLVRKWWEASKGTGKFAVQGKGGNWYIFRVPWFGNPELITHTSSKKSAMEKAEGYM